MPWSAVQVVSQWNKSEIEILSNVFRTKANEFADDKSSNSIDLRFSAKIHDKKIYLSLQKFTLQDVLLSLQKFISEEN